LDSLAATAEPGVLAVLKMLPRRDITNIRGAAATAKSAKTAAILKSRQEEDLSAGRWLVYSEKFLRSLCERLRTAGGSNTETPDLPIKLNPGADVKTSFRVDLPQGKANSKGDSTSFLRVRYVRIEQRARPSRVVAFYRRQLKEPFERLSKDDVWLDSVDTSGDTLRSFDVFITRPSVASAAEQEQRIVVEIVMIECERFTTKPSRVASAR
jgi:hypothetical protein